MFWQWSNYLWKVIAEGPERAVTTLKGFVGSTTPVLDQVQFITTTPSPTVFDNHLLILS